MNNTTEKKLSITTAMKPKPPLSAYNLFFQVERKRILEGTDSFGMPISEEDLNIAVWKHKAKSGKRLHRKTHGKIGFKELACVVANRWKKLDSRSRKMLKDHAQMEKQEYGRLMEEWKKKSEEFGHDITWQIEQVNINLHTMFSKNKQQEPVQMQSSASSSWLGNADDKPKPIVHTGDFDMLQSMWRQLVSDSSVDPPIGDESLQVQFAMPDGFSHPRREETMNFLGHLEKSAQQNPQDNHNSEYSSDESCYVLSCSDKMKNGTGMQCIHTMVPWDHQEQTAQLMVHLNEHVLEPTPLLESGTVAANVSLNCPPLTGFKPTTCNNFRGYVPNTGSEPKKSNVSQRHGFISLEEEINPCSFPIHPNFPVHPDLHGVSAPEDRNQWDELCYLASLLESF